MKTLFTLLIIILTSSTVLAQNNNSNDKVDTIEMGIVMVDSLDNAKDSKTITIDSETRIVRLYRYKNSRVKKELTFQTKKHSPKMA